MRTDQRADRKLRRTAVALWFAVERMRRGNPGRTLPPPPDDDPDDGGSNGGDDTSRSGVPKRPAPMGGSAAAAVPEEGAE